MYLTVTVVALTGDSRSANYQNLESQISCIIEFIKRVGGKDKMRGFAEHLIGFPQRD